MGAQTFTAFAEGKNAQDAFRTARDNAAYEYGHGGYTGSIAEKHDFVIIKDRVCLTEKDAYALVSELMDNEDERIDDKWGPAGCIEVTQPKAPLNKGYRRFLFFGWASS